jgi:hypothetical protein
VSESDRLFKRIDEGIAKQDVRCPRCKLALELADRGHLVTYWGETGWQHEECYGCGHEFEVQECVVRTFETRELKK